MRVVAARALSITAALGLLLPSSVALADAVPPPPDDCPKGQVGVTSHGGPACMREAPKDCAPGYRGEVGGTCVLAACSSDQECEAGSRCVQVDTCQELRELHWTGWGWSAERARTSGNFLAEPPSPPPSGDAPEAWVKLHICGQDGPCDSPAECRPMGLCYLTNSIGKTKAKVVATPPVPEKLPDGVYTQSLIAPNQGRDLSRPSGGCHKGCSVAVTDDAAAWLLLPLLGAVRVRRRLRRARAKRAGFAAATVLVALLGCASVAWGATPEGRASARQHAARAEELKKQGKLAEACAELAEVERLDPKLPTLLELAECTESLGKLVEAQAQWTLARDQAKHDEKPQSRARAEAKLTELQKRVAHLTLQLAAGVPPGAQVLRDDVALEPASLGGALPVNPGEHVIVVKLAGHDDAKFTVKLAEGENQTLPITAGRASAAQASAPSAAAAPLALTPALPTVVAPAPPAEPPPATGWWTGPRKAGVIAGSVGLVAIGAGSALCVIASGDAGGRVDSRLALGGLSIATGSVLFVSGLVLLASASRDDATQHARVRVTPTFAVAHNTTMLGAVGEF